MKAWITLEVDYKAFLPARKLNQFNWFWCLLSGGPTAKQFLAPTPA
jgi:hypothetical protein